MLILRAYFNREFEIISFDRERKNWRKRIGK